MRRARCNKRIRGFWPGEDVERRGAERQKKCREADHAPSGPHQEQKELNKDK